jgi:hypothetical protein
VSGRKPDLQHELRDAARAVAIANSPLDEFRRQCDRLAGLVRQGVFPKAKIVDGLSEISTAHGFVDGESFIREAFAKNKQANGGGPHQNPSALALTFFDELAETPPKPWLIKNVIARGETSSWIAPPGKGKSALLADIAVHAASAKDWRGHRTKGRSGVVYFALERALLVKRRFAAHRRRDDLPRLPIAVAGQVIDLMNRSCVDVILATIWEAEQHFACKVGLAIIDTYAKGIAAGGGDEDKAKDQNIVQANLRRVLDRVDMHIAGIGHTGKDESRGERGSNARLADVDVLVQVTGDTVKTVTVKKGNDQPEGVLTGFQLEPFDLGVDEDGDPVHTFIVGKEIYAGAQADRPLSDRQKLALEALAEAILAHGRDAPREYGLPTDIKVVTTDEWKTELFRQNVLEASAPNPRARCRELRLALAARKMIGSCDDFVWPVCFS